MLLLGTNTGCKNNVAKECKTQQVSATKGQIPRSTERISSLKEFRIITLEMLILILYWVRQKIFAQIWSAITILILGVGTFYNTAAKIWKLHINVFISFKKLQTQTQTNKSSSAASNSSSRTQKGFLGLLYVHTLHSVRGLLCKLQNRINCIFVTLAISVFNWRNATLTG